MRSRCGEAGRTTSGSTERILVLLPFVSGVKDRKRLLTELAGKISLYRYYIRALNVPVSSVSFEVLTEETDPETEGLLRDIAHGEL